MDWPEQCAVVIPCLNEAATIESLVIAVRRYLPAVIVVDDGSTDGTADWATKGGAEVIRHERPRGKGAALAAGWGWAREQGFSWALSLDGDGQHAPADIPALLACAQRTGAPLVVGNRMTNPAGMPWLRCRVNRWMSGRISRLTGRALPDTQCGFRLMRMDAWARVHVQADHFEIESELLCKFIAAGHTVEFVPVRVIYRDEQSKIQPVRDTRRWFRWWWQTRGWHKTRVLDQPLGGMTNYE
ncbi:MAG TPA: glycosyltransferase family 2 protein [Haliangiales bacterium]|nr:glycosyltransferase family 2 protein [Haliangiales bacterium]